MGLDLDLVLGAIASLLLGLGLLMMKARGEALPAAHRGTILRAIGAWLCDPTWLGGLVIQTAGYALYVVALGGAPVSIVAVVMQGGIGLFVLFAVLVLGERAGATEWAGIGVIIVAVVMLTASLGAGAAQGRVNPEALTVVAIACVVAALAALSMPRLSRSGAAPAIASGIAFGLGGLFTKAFADLLVSGGGASAAALRAVESPYLYLIIAVNIAGLVLLQNAFHYARGIIAMPLSSAFSNVVPIIGGMAAFGEHLPARTDAAAMRVTAFVLTIAAGALLATRERIEEQPAVRSRVSPSISSDLIQPPGQSGG